MNQPLSFSVWWEKNLKLKQHAVLKIIADRTGYEFENYQKYYFFMTRMRRAV